MRKSSQKEDFQSMICALEMENINLMEHRKAKGPKLGVKSETETFIATREANLRYVDAVLTSVLQNALNTPDFVQQMKSFKDGIDETLGEEFKVSHDHEYVHVEIPESPIDRSKLKVVECFPYFIYRTRHCILSDWSR